MQGNRRFPTLIRRVVDIAVSLAGIVILSPLLLVLYFIVILKMGRPAVFRHIRAGKNGIPFTLYKFRTMSNSMDRKGKLLSDEQRLTPFGKALRKTSLDELPQLFNVLKGNMSLIGPRPLLLEYVPLYSREQAKRLTIKPGITGWAQVNGRNTISWEEKFALDVWYVENRNLLLDMKILLMTFFKVMQARGISGQEQATMPVFRGSREEKGKSGETK